MRRLSLAYLTLFNATPAEVVTAAAAGGFDSVGLRISGRKPGETGFDLIGNPTAIREVRRRLNDTGLIHSHVSTYHVGPDLALADIRRAIDTSVELAAEMIVINCTDPEEDRWVALMMQYCDVAADCGIRLALEFVPYSEVKTIGRAVQLLKRMGRPNFGLAIDALHLARSGGSPADIACVDPALIFVGQLCDAPLKLPAGMELATESRTGRQYPGDGELPLHDFIDALPDTLEIDCEIPSPKHAHLPVNDQARQAGEMCRRFLEVNEQRKASALSS